MPLWTRTSSPTWALLSRSSFTIFGFAPSPCSLALRCCTSVALGSCARLRSVALLCARCCAQLRSFALVCTRLRSVLALVCAQLHSFALGSCARLRSIVLGCIRLRSIALVCARLRSIVLGCIRLRSEAGANRFLRCSAVRVQSLSRRRFCSVVVIARRAVRHAPGLASTASRAAVLPVYSHYLSRRRLCSVAALARRAVRHASMLAPTDSRVAVLPVCSHYLGVGFAPSSCSLVARCCSCSACAAFKLACCGVA